MADGSAAWMGIDLGTQSAKIGVYRADGSAAHQGERRYPVAAPAPGAMVQQPDEDWWGAARTLLRDATRAIDSTSVRAVGLCSTFPTFCLLDEHGASLGEGLLYGDARAAGHVPAVTAALGIRLEGDEVTPRLAWLRDVRPRLLERARLALGPSGFVGLRLTGVASIDPHGASRWGGIANRAGDGWDFQRVHRLGIDPGILPPVRAFTEVIGEVTADAADDTGLSAGTPVVTGSTDTLASMIGHGAVSEGDVMIYYGSSGYAAVCAHSLRAVVADPVRMGPTGPYVLGALAIASGIFIARIRSSLRGSYKELDESAEEVEPGAEGVVVVPPAKPSADGSAFGLVGLGLGHGRGHLWRAALESFGHLMMEADLPGVGGAVVAGGGGARSTVWRQVVTDMLGREQRFNPDGSAARGAAFLAGLGVGDLRWDADATRWFEGEEYRTFPGRGRTARYRVVHTAWQEVRTRLRSLTPDRALPPPTMPASLPYRD